MREAAREMRSLLLSALLLTACGDDDRRPVDGGGDVARVDGGGIDSGGLDSGGVDSGRRPAPYVDPECTDGMYSEPLPDIDADISDLSFTGDVGAYVDAVLARRYPAGALAVTGGRMNRDFGMDCDVLFAGSPSSAADVMSRLNTIVHECGHLHDLGLSMGTTNIYVLTSERRLTCERGDSDARGGDTFARSRITGDEYSALRPPCDGTSTPGCDSYADVYLDGNPDDGTFEGGDQGFNLLFEETVQYVNSLATEWAIVDQMAPGRRTSARDGILTFLWYVERYLRMARLEYPEAYTRITDSCWRDAILTVWGRAWFYLEQTDGIAALAIDNDALFALVTAPELLEEIDRLRDLACP